MSQTIAQRHGTRIHVPLTPVIALVVAAIVAAAVLILINQPTFTSTTTQTSVSAATAVQAAAVPKPESLALRRQVIEQAQAAPASPAEWRVLHNHAQGTTLDTMSVGALAPAAISTGASTERRTSPYIGKAR